MTAFSIVSKIWNYNNILHDVCGCHRNYLKQRIIKLETLGYSIPN